MTEITEPMAGASFMEWLIQPLYLHDWNTAHNTLFNTFLLSYTVVPISHDAVLDVLPIWLQLGYFQK